jgi:NAD(P)H-flavin reductase
VNYGNYTFKVVSNEEIAPNILQLVVTADGAENFLGGQYYSFKVADKVNRSYSIASGPQQKDIEFIVDITPGGPGSKFVEALKPGDEFSGMGAFGFFTLEKTNTADSEEPLLFVATGTGIAPFRSMIIDLLENKKTTRPITLYFGLRYDDQTYYFEDFYKLAEKYPNFRFVPVISRPSEKWSGEVGHCQTSIMKQPVVENAKVYICGRSETVVAMAQDLIDYGYPKERVHFEKFG